LLNQPKEAANIANKNSHDPAAAILEKEDPNSTESFTIKHRPSQW